MRRWPQIRAGAIAIAVVLGLVDGCPLPSPNQTPEWERGFVEPIRSLQRVVEWPVAWIQPALRVSQRWAVYQAPGVHRYRLWIDGEDEHGVWRVLYRGADADHTEDADVIEAARVWGSWDPSDALPGQYRGFGNWILGRALARHPDLRVARIRHEKIELVPGGFVPSGQFAFAMSRVRSGP